MQLTDVQLTSFKQLYQEQFGVDLTDEEAHEKAAHLVRMVEFVYKPMTKEEQKQVLLRKAMLARSITKIK